MPRGFLSFAQMGKKLTRDADVLFLAHDVFFCPFQFQRNQAARPSACSALAAEKFLAK